MIPSLICRLILVLAALMVGSTVAHGQGALDKTTLGQSQNDSRDLANSLIPGPKHYGKGEKKEEVDPKKLTSKTVKDPKFEGSLVEMGLGSNGDPDLHLEKASTASDKDSKASKQADAGGEKSPDRGAPDRLRSAALSGLGQCPRVRLAIGQEEHWIGEERHGRREP